MTAFPDFVCITINLSNASAGNCSLNQRKLDCFFAEFLNARAVIVKKLPE